MATIEAKVKHALNEARILVLGTQVLVGFHYRAVLEPGFDQLTRLSQLLILAGLAFLLVTIALLMSPATYHQIVERGEDTRGLHHFTSSVMAVALWPFASALGLDFYVAGDRLLGSELGVVLAAGAAVTALFCWYGIAVLARAWGVGDVAGKGDAMEREERTPIGDRIDHVLTEARVVLPGAQALLGFQFAGMLTDGFERLPFSSQVIHLVSLGLIALTTIFLMTPAAWHRIVERGEHTERFHRLAAAFVIAAMVPLALGLAGDMFVVGRKITGSVPVALVLAVLALTLFFGLWFGYTTWRARTGYRDERETVAPEDRARAA